MMELTDKDFKIVIINMILIFMEASLVAQTVKLLPVCPQCGDPGSIPGMGRSPGEGNGNPLQHSWPAKSHGRRSLIGYSPWGRKESDTTERLHFHLYSWKEKKKHKHNTIENRTINKWNF